MIAEARIAAEARRVQEEPQAELPIRISLPRLGNSATAGQPSALVDELAQAASRITKIHAPRPLSDRPTRRIAHRRPSRSFD